MRFVDLKTQYERLHGSINKRIQAVLDHGQYILGAVVVELETVLAEYVGAELLRRGLQWDGCAPDGSHGVRRGARG